MLIKELNENYMQYTTTSQEIFETFCISKTQKKYLKINENKKMIALTFDDGPDEDFTPQILDILKKYNAKATFFVVGQKVGWNPEIVKRAYKEGHEIGNHTFTHINICKSTNEQIINEINKTQKIIKDFKPQKKIIHLLLFNNSIYLQQI